MFFNEKGNDSDNVWNVLKIFAPYAAAYDLGAWPVPYDSRMIYIWDSIVNPSGHHKPAVASLPMHK